MDSIAASTVAAGQKVHSRKWPVKLTLLEDEVAPLTRDSTAATTRLLCGAGSSELVFIAEWTQLESLTGPNAIAANVSDMAVRFDIVVTCYAFDIHSVIIVTLCTLIVQAYFEAQRAKMVNTLDVLVGPQAPRFIRSHIVCVP